MKTRIIILNVAVASTIAGCQYDQHTAPESPPAPEIGRYEFELTDSRLTRYDTVTGDVAICEITREASTDASTSADRYSGETRSVEFACYNVRGLGSDGSYTYFPSQGEWYEHAPAIEQTESTQGASSENPETD